MNDGDLSSRKISQPNDDEMLEWLHDNRCTDGLPVVLPTRRRVEEMLLAAASAGFDQDIVIGSVGPGNGEATIEKIAINAVMAGCRADCFPIVIAAMKAICDPRLDITEVQATTHELTPLIIVNGPAARDCGMAGGYGALGYGHRANVTIGRAVRLCLINIGGGWPGLSDMSVLGHPGKLTFCVAEDEDSSPFPPLHTSLGFSADQSAVTVTCVGGPRSMLIVTDADDPQRAERVLQLVALSIATFGANNAQLSRGTVVVGLNPDHARILHEAGLSRQDIQRELHRRASNPTMLVDQYRGSIPKQLFGELTPATSSPESILVIVIGGPGLYSVVMLPWGAGPHENPYVSAEIIQTDVCEIPVSATSS